MALQNSSQLNPATSDPNMDPKKLHNCNTAFFRLPDEVRRKIYQFAGGNTIFTVDVESLPQNVINASNWGPAARLHPTFPHRLSQVCSASREETTFPAPEAARCFEFTGYADSLEDFLSSLTFLQRRQEIYNLKIIVTTRDWSLLEDLDHRDYFPGIGFDCDTLLIDRVNLVPLLFPLEFLFCHVLFMRSCHQLKRIRVEWENVQDDGLITKSDVGTAISEWLSRVKISMPQDEMVNLVDVCEDPASEDTSLGSADMDLSD
ncbi:hypothetical protein IQ07DRAFT_639608 [Pyrenochaeta sp. DS3sAY3a]|nr:hypothetical protein IQ07DRAFT_639608 [Pyrenochaeta sp. DS3sAY3a]